MPNLNPKPPKRKKCSVHSRNVRGGKQKTTSFNYEEAREELGVPNPNFQQIAAESLQTGTNPRPPKIKSPLKAKVKKQLAQKELQNAKLDVAHERMERKVSSLMAQVRDLSKALMDEKKKSLAMQRLLDDAEAMLAESAVERDDLERKMTAAELAIEMERQRAQEAVRDERDYMSLSITAGKYICR
jgi:chromosome segregation ATPase